MASKPNVEAMRKAVADKKASAFKRAEEDASETFGKGTKRVRYTDPHSAGYMEVLHRPEGFASTLSLEVPEEHRRKGIAGRLQEHALKEFPAMQGQVSSKHAAKSAYRLGRRPYGMPKATLEDVFKQIDEDSSVNMLSPKRQQDIDAINNQAAPQYAKGGAVNTPTVEQMRQFIMQYITKAKMLHKADGGAVDIATVGINEAPDMDVKEAAMPAATDSNTMPTGGVDFQPQMPGTQFAPAAPAPQQDQAPGMPQVGQSVGMPGQNMPTMPTPEASSPVAAGAPPTNILSRTPQGNMLQAMKPMARMAKGGSTTTAQMKQELEKFLEHSHVKHRLYHGTKNSFKAFDPTKANSSSKTQVPEGTMWFTDRPDIADTYPVKYQGDFSKEYHEGANIMPVHAQFKKPLKINAKGENWNDILHKGEYKSINDIADFAKKSGKYDSVIVKNVKDKGKGFSTNTKPSNTYIAFHPTQIKSAIGNRGTYDTTNPDLNMKTGGKVKGVIKEKVKVSPTGDAMMYELTRAQRYTKKVK